MLRDDAHGRRVPYHHHHGQFALQHPGEQPQHRLVHVDGRARLEQVENVAARRELEGMPTLILTDHARAKQLGVRDHTLKPTDGIHDRELPKAPIEELVGTLDE